MRQTEYPALEERVLRERLPNGLTVLVVPKPGFARKAVYLATPFGSVHRRFTLDGQARTVPAGAAHYLEHKLFDLPDRDVTAEFAALGASVNAFTSYDMTACYFSCTENFEDCLRLLLEFVFTPWFPQEAVEKERGIIAQEIAMNDDSPDTRVSEALMEAMYARHPAAEPILGTRESIERITPEILALCHRAYYDPARMCLCVVGDVDPRRVQAIAGEIPAAHSQVCRRRYREAMTCPRSYTACEMDIAMPTFQMGFKCEPVGRGTPAIRREFIGDLAAEALFGEASELYLELYQSGLIDGSFGGGFDTADGMAMLTCFGDSPDPAAVREAVLERARTLADSGIPEDALLELKRSALGRRIRDLDSFDGTCFRLCAYAFSGFDYFRFPQVYAAVTGEDIRAFLGRVVTPSRCALSVIFPKEEPL